MNVPFARLHRDSAVALFRQRRGWQAQDEAAAVALGRLERRLRLHLHVLARCGDEDPVPEKAPETFVHLAARLAAPDAGRRSEGRGPPAPFLPQGAAGGGAFAALALLAPQEAEGSLLDLYRSHEGLRPTLFRLWREQGAAVPAALVARDELRRGDVDLQRSALEYAAESPAVGPEIFRSFYQPYLGGATATRVHGTLLAAALWGGMVRGDREASRTLRSVLELETGGGDDALLRLAALGGDIDLLPVLRHRFETDPAPGAELLALHGTAGAIALLLEGVKQPPTRTAVARAWPWLSGSPLPVVPRLRLVGDEEARESAASLPDAQSAIRWWEGRRKEGERRWIAGAAMSTVHLADLAGKKGERPGATFSISSPCSSGALGVSANAEQARRRSALHNALNQAPSRAIAPRRSGVSRHV